MAKVAENVFEFINRASKMVGRRASEYFDIDARTECVDLDMESPIEHLFYVAFNAVRDIDNQPHDEPISIGDKQYIVGLGVYPQYKVGKYRADFLGESGHINRYGENIRKQVIIECDSQQFHERTEKERRYEKARDRFFQKEGYTIFRYTGKELIEDPFLAACEVIAYLTNQTTEVLYNYVMDFE